MIKEVLISVDLDYFNYAPVADLYSIVAACAAHGEDVKATMNGDHLPESFNAWPNRRGRSWKNYLIWNYDEHDDFGNDDDSYGECIGDWAYRLFKKGAEIVWISEAEHAYSCCHDRRQAPPRLDPGSIPSIPSSIKGLAFFTSPGYLQDESLVYKVLSACRTYGIKVNNKKADNWTLADMKKVLKHNRFQ